MKETEQLRVTNDEKIRLEAIFLTEEEFEEKLRNVGRIQLGRHWKNEALYNALIDKLELDGKKVKFDIKQYRDFNSPGVIIADWLRETNRGREYNKDKISAPASFIYNFVKRIWHCDDEDEWVIDYKTIKPSIFELLLIITYRAMEDRVSNTCSTKKWRLKAIHLQDNVDDTNEELERKNAEVAALKAKNNRLIAQARRMRDENFELKDRLDELDELEFGIKYIEI